MVVAVFTGASRGIGAALAQRAGQRSGTTIAIGRTAPAFAVSRFVETDLSRTQETARALEGCLEMVRGRTVWFFDAAATLPLGAAGEMGFVESAQKAFNLSAVAPLVIGAALAAAGPEHLTVVHLTSGAAQLPIPGWAAYGMAKAAASLGWRTFVAERASVRLHLVDPGIVDTGMQRGLREAQDPAAAPVERLKTADRAAEEILREVGFPT